MIGKLGGFAIHHTGCFGLRMTVTIGCTAGIIALVSGGMVSAGGAKAERASDNSKQLVDVVAGTLFDGWGEAAVQTLSMYYGPDSSQSAVEMLGYTGSVRAATDQGGTVAASLGYDGDWGLTRIEGQTAAATYAGMESFFRFQGQEQEIFPLSELDITDDALAGWLDQLQLYHFPYREYSAGLAIFLSIDPAGASISPYGAFASNPANYADPTGAVGQFMPSSRNMIFGFVWGVTLAVGYYYLEPMYTGDDFEPLYAGLLLGGTKVIAQIVDNILVIHETEVQGRKVLVRGYEMLRNYNSKHSGAHDSDYTVKMEIAESAGMGIVYALSKASIGSDTLAVSLAHVFAFSIVAFIDAGFERLREDTIKYKWEPVFKLLSDEREQGNLIWEKIKFVLTNNMGDKLAYTALAISYGYGLRGVDSPVTYFIFPGRNAMARAANKQILDWIGKACCGKGEKLIAYTPGEDKAIYVSDLGPQKEVLTYAAGRPKQIRRSGIRDLWNAPRPQQQAPSHAEAASAVLLPHNNNQAQNIVDNPQIHLQIERDSDSRNHSHSESEESEDSHSGLP